jgi:hypothetical protein
VRNEEPASKDDAGQDIVLMNFTAPADLQWFFLKYAVSIAAFDNELGAIAAAPFEHLLSFHGEGYISSVETEHRTNQNFSRMTTGAWQCGMSDEIWSAIEAIQAAVIDPI